MSNTSFYNLSNQLARYSDLPETSSSCLISNCRNDLKFALKGLAQLRQTVEQVKTHQQELDEREWAAKMFDIEKQKQEISSRVQKYEGTNLLGKIQDLLKRRRKKRESMKRKKLRLKIERNNAQLNRQKLHKFCDDWVKQKAEKDLERRRMKEASDRSELVLYSVNKRIASAERYLHIFEMVTKLRKSRYHANPRTDGNEKGFLEKLNRLRSVWSNALLSYSEEKKKLQSFLSESSKPLEHQWREALFGEGIQDNTHNMEATSLQQLIEIRHTWDSYIVPADCDYGSSIPVGWVTPNENPLEEWKRYRSKQNSI